MPRDLDAAIVAELESKSTLSVYLIDLQLESAEVNLTSGPININYNDKVYIKAPTLGIEGLEDSMQLQGADIDVSLSGVASIYASAIESQEFRGNDLIVYLALIDETAGTIIDEPWIVHKGVINSTEMNRDASNGTFTIVLNVGNFFARFDEVTGIRTNPTEWKDRYPGDAIFDQVPKLQAQEIELRF